METNEFFAVLFLIANFVVYLFKDTNKFCASVWFVLKSFWIALFAVLAYGFIKDQFNKK
jgi:hypothetical protein